MHALSASSTDELRSMPKLVSVPEVHRLLNTSDGGDFLDQIARMGRARNTSLQIDLQELTTVQAHEGLVEQITTLNVFQLTTRAEQDAAAAMCGMEIGPESRAVFDNLAASSRIDEVRKGHCVMRDPSGRAATVQRTAPDEDVLARLDTTPVTGDRPQADPDSHRLDTQEAVA